MGPETYLRRLGFESQGWDQHWGWRIVAAILLLYALGFFAWYPRAATNTDEAMFLNQTQLLLQGTTTIEKVDPLSGETVPFSDRWYAIGLPALMAPFVWAGGPRAAYLVPLISIVAAVLLMGRWLVEQGYSPVFALLVLSFLPTLVMGRVAMSDAPSLALVSLGLWLFWRGLDRRWPWWLASGFIAGISTAVRIGNALPFVGLYAGTVLRREPRCLALEAVGLLGLGMRMVASHLYFGDALYERAYYPLELQKLGERLGLYLLGLLVLVPGGLLAGFAYRGRRRPEVIATVLFYFAFYLFQGFSTDTTGFAKRIVLSLRYFMELLPILVLAIADVAPRAWVGVLSRLQGRARRRVSIAAATAVSLWLGALAVASVAVHAYLDGWTASQAAIADAIHRHTGDESVILTNPDATRKFLRLVDQHYVYLSIEGLDATEIDELLSRHEKVFLVLLDRSDSDYWIARSKVNQDFVESLEVGRELELDQRFSPSDRLRVWSLGSRGH